MSRIKKVKGIPVSNFVFAMKQIMNDERHEWIIRDLASSLIATVSGVTKRNAMKDSLPNFFVLGVTVYSENIDGKEFANALSISSVIPVAKIKFHTQDKGAASVGVISDVGKCTDEVLTEFMKVYCDSLGDGAKIRMSHEAPDKTSCLFWTTTTLDSNLDALKFVKAQKEGNCGIMGACAEVKRRRSSFGSGNFKFKM